MSPPMSSAQEAGATQASPTSIRVLELFFAIFESRGGVRQDHLARLAGYRGMSDDHFRVALHRDLDQLRDMGVRWSERTIDRHIVYQIDNDSVQSGSEYHLSPDQLLLIHMGIQAVTPVDERMSQIVDMTLRATVDEVMDKPLPAHAPVVEYASEGIASILRAISDGIPLSFAYTSATESDVRTVEPWRLLIRGHAMYVWGFDLDRQAPRVFRLSRIEGPIDLVGEPGDCDHPAPQGVDPFEGYRVAPVLLIAEASALPFSHDLTPCAVSDRMIPGPVPQGWRLVKGRERSLFEWRHRIVDRARECVVVEPAWLQREILHLLDRAASHPDWGPNA